MCVNSKSKYAGLRVGQTFNKWTITGEQQYNKHKKICYPCKCICGVERIIEGRALVAELSKSCGCVNKKSPEEIRAARRKYKAEYFQQNKEKIYARQRSRPTPKEKVWEYNLRSNYGIEPDEFWAYWIAYKGCCMACGRQIKIDFECSGGVKNHYKRAVVDHCHKTSKFRGILCSRCNLGIGQFENDPSLLRKVAEYLENRND